MKSALLITLSTIFLSGCTTTKLVDHWQDADFKRGSLDNVLIVAVTSNTTYRFLFETELERRMTKAGLNGVTSLSAMGDKYPEKEAVEKYIAANNIDYVMATRLSSVQEVKERVPTVVSNFYTGPYYPTYGSYYGGTTIVRGGYTDTQTTVVLVVTIYDTKTGAPVWVGHTQTFEPGSIHNLAGELAKVSWAKIAR